MASAEEVSHAAAPNATRKWEEAVVLEEDLNMNESLGLAHAKAIQAKVRRAQHKILSNKWKPCFLVQFS